MRWVVAALDGPRMLAPPVDGHREIRCERFHGDVIAAGRCLEYQKEGCICKNAAPPEMAVELARATSSLRSGRRFQAPARKGKDIRKRQIQDRDRWIMEALANGCDVTAIAKVIGMQVRSLERLARVRRRANAGEEKVNDGH